MNSAIEIRAAQEIKRSSPGRLFGYAAVFDKDSLDLGGFTESIRPGAFARSLVKPNNILAVFEHDTKSLLGRLGAGTLALQEDELGLRFEIQLPPTTIGKDLEILVDRGDIAGASFAFMTPKGGDVWGSRNGMPHRELLDVDLLEITITAMPAYPDTNVAKRALQPTMLSRPLLKHATRFLETI